jgi:6-phosphogluconolactonase
MTRSLPGRAEVAMTRSAPDPEGIMPEGSDQEGQMNRIVVVPETDFDETVAESLAGALLDTVGTGPVNLTLAGGGTPRGGYERLAEAPSLTWEKLEIFFGDERAVPPHHSESNFHMAMEALLSRVPVPPGQIHRMEADLPDREMAARRYEAVLPDALDILVLGIGSDGHTASLFPGGEPVRERSRRVVPARGPAPPRDRLTITPPVIQSASRVFVLARGEGKAAPVSRALEGPFDPVGCPAQLARAGTWILDEAAAKELGRTRGEEGP